ncbi:hypothetical protein ACLB2K_019262 [Fragaria x ananassa]
MKLSGGVVILDLFPSLRFLSFVTGTIPAMRKTMENLGVVLDRIIDDHKRKRSIKDDKPAGGGVDHNDDHQEEEALVDVLLKHHESNKKLDFKLTTGQIKDVVMEIFTAGSDSTAA